MSRCRSAADPSAEEPTMPSSLIIIPARLAATRLPNKPLADIHGRPMIVHVWERAMRAGLGRVVVATDAVEIAAAVGSAGGEAVMTRCDHPSGSDRVFEALEAVDPERRIDVVINLQGDFPTIDPAIIQACFAPLVRPEVDIATLAAIIDDEEERTASSVVKVVGTPVAAAAGSGDGPPLETLRALYFTRATAPSGDGPHYHHIGIYAYRRAALERFVQLPPSPLELREKLEQLRALEAGMRIDVAIVADVPRGVDTPPDLERARRLLAG
jgi:3-deoxy-manno-octulosonate cytidylyltransferase (CMP-KDO synthetase)